MSRRKSGHRELIRSSDPVVVELREVAGQLTAAAYLDANQAVHMELKRNASQLRLAAQLIDGGASGWDEVTGRDWLTRGRHLLDVYTGGSHD